MDVSVEKNVQYALHDGVALSGELYSPKGGAGKTPILIAVHGGAWKLGSAGFYQYWGPYLASRGIAVFSVDYRLVAGAANRYPAAVHDVRAAVQFVRANAGRLGIDAERIGLAGDSAGGHLSALVALAGDQPEFRSGYPKDPHAATSTAVKVVAGVYGVYDLIAQWQHDLVLRTRDNIGENFLGTSPLEDRRIFHQASPLTYVTSHANKTAFLLIWGTEDEVVDWHTQSWPFLTALRQAAYFTRSVVIPGAGHYWMTQPIDEPHSHAAMLAPKLARFLKDQL